MVVSRHQNTGQNHNLLIANKSSENVARFVYLGTAITNEVCIRKEGKKRLNSEDACNHFVQSLLSSRLPYKNLKDSNVQNHSFTYCFVLV
jgi:hypothetical protein